MQYTFQYITDYKKAKRTVESCKTIKQLDNAINIIHNFKSKWSNAKLHSHILRKQVNILYDKLFFVWDEQLKEIKN